ncbi:hypothetical protein SAMN05216480_11398 [Pustulibacterium marinum]|uniref:AB hydrolase-1 domain-containing protein n=1 Tax=Pustulibacterium marinum TaxID=1224947 RepID=A0A1I7I7V7_9FLAO|nr:alpha/beta fold hydrolase [Pustulibacterium marinum]SFU69047.1 hypothetical protein SAMN05216480_11398 [Pustulibacterium marinum]
MPLLTSTYKPSLLFRNGHFATIYASVFRKVQLEQERERIHLDDGDFLDLDWSYTEKKTDKLLLVLHGLEGNANRPYIKGAAKIFNENGYDACAMNFRSCSGEDNKLFSSYHSGKTDDLALVIAHILKLKKYQTIILKGFSLGANVVLKYLGNTENIPSEVKAGIAISVPCYLYGSMLQLHKMNNKLYHEKFRIDLLKKLKFKQQAHPDKLSKADIAAVKTLKDFDDIYTSRAHNFKNGLDYYEKASSLPHLKNIEIPTLIINAKNDSFLSKECYPLQEAEQNPNLYLEMPNYGGHVGFIDSENMSYTEKRSINFIKNQLK